MCVPGPLSAVGKRNEKTKIIHVLEFFSFFPPSHYEFLCSRALNLFHFSPLAQPFFRLFPTSKEFSLTRLVFEDGKTFFRTRSKFQLTSLKVMSIHLSTRHEQFHSTQLNASQIATYDVNLHVKLVRLLFVLLVARSRFGRRWEIQVPIGRRWRLLQGALLW